MHTTSTAEFELNWRRRYVRCAPPSTPRGRAALMLKQAGFYRSRVALMLKQGWDDFSVQRNANEARKHLTLVRAALEQMALEHDEGRVGSVRIDGRAA